MKTLADAVAKYIHGHYLNNLASTRCALKKASQLSWWQTALGKCRLDKLTPAKISHVLGEMDAAPATRNRYLAALSSLLAVAQREWGWIEHNPARGVTRWREPSGRLRYLNDHEREALLKCASFDSDERIYPLIVLALYTGARQGELLRLRWRHVDLERGRVYLQTTKNGDRRTLYLAGPALQVIREMNPGDPDELVLSRTFPRHAWERVKRSAGLEEGLRFHDLRHTFASYAAMSGASVRDLSEALGHKTMSMVKRYSHLSDSHVAGVVERMVERYS